MAGIRPQISIRAENAATGEAAATQVSLPVQSLPGPYAYRAWPLASTDLTTALNYMASQGYALSYAQFSHGWLHAIFARS